MATVRAGKVLILGAGGPVGAAAIQVLKDEYTLRVSDARPMEEITREESLQGPRAPVPELLGPPHENRVVDVTQYDQVLEACYGMDAAINLSVVRPHPEKAFTVNMVGAYNVAKAAVECGLKRLIHTGPLFQTGVDNTPDYWHDYNLVDDVPLHPGDNLYGLTKYLGGHITRVFAERCGLEVLVFLYCGFRPGEVEEEEKGKGVGPFTVSWEDAGRAFLCGLRASEMPTAHEIFFISSRLPQRKYGVDKASRLLGWETEDTFEALFQRKDF